MSDSIDVLIKAFGGVRPMAAKMEEATNRRCPPSTIQYWQQIGYVPNGRLPDVRAAIQFHGLPVRVSDQFENTAADQQGSAA